MKNIIFAIPGRQFSGNFLQCWTDTVLKCIRNGINPLLSNKFSSMVSYARCLCLGADVRRGPNQAPFDGKIDYEYIMWIDSDQVFSFESDNYEIWVNFINLIKVLATTFLTMAMAAVGISINLNELKSMGYKPFIVGFIAAITVGIVSIISMETFLKYFI